MSEQMLGDDELDAVAGGTGPAPTSALNSLRAAVASNVPQRYVPAAPVAPAGYTTVNPNAPGYVTIAARPSTNAPVRSP